MPWGALAGGLIAGIGSAVGGGEAASAAGDAANTNLQEFNTITQQESPFMQSGYGGLQSLDYLLGIEPGGVSSPNQIPGLGDSLYGLGGGSPINLGGGFGYAPGGGQTIPGGGPPTAPPGGSPGGGFGSLVTPFTTQDWQQLSPMYNFQLQQGQQGVLNADSGSQGALSGAALKDLISFNQGTANSSFNNAFNLYQQQQGNIFNRLMGVTGLGQTAAANTGAQGTTLAGNIGSAQIAGGNAIGTGISNLGNAFGNSASSWAAYNALGQGGGSPSFDSGTSFNSGGLTYDTGYAGTPA